MKTCHIRNWSTEGRSKEGKKVQVFCWSCAPHGQEGRSTSKNQRLREISEHREEYDR